MYTPALSPINADPALRAYLEREFHSISRTFGTLPADGSVVRLEQYGGRVGSAGASDNVIAFAAALDALGARGGTIELGLGAYFFDAQLDELVNRRSIIVRGQGGMSAGAAPATQMIYTGTASPWINASGGSGIFFEDLHFDFNNASFTGTLLKVGNSGSADAFRCGVKRCTMGSSVGTGCTHLDLDKVIEFVAEQCAFYYGNPSIKGQDSSGSSYSNVVTFDNCTWYASRSVPVVRAGEAWTFINPTVTPGAPTGQAGFFDSETVGFINLNVDGGWFGDVTVGGGTWIRAIGEALNVRGARFGGHATSTKAIDLNGVEGFVIEGNTFDTFTSAVNFGAATNFGGSIRANRHHSVTDFYGTPANAPDPADCDYGINYPLTATP